MGKRVLVIGGTGFLGRHLTGEALRRGHAVTLFHRGHTDAGFPASVGRIHGDRRAIDDVARAALSREWDLVIDTCAYFPDDVDALAGALHGRTPRYVLLSSCSVYARGQDSNRGGLTELSATLGVKSQGHGPPVGCGSGSAAGKLACEHLLAANFPGLLVLRLGLVTGPGDPTGRLAYWIERGLRGGVFLVPMRPPQLIQMLDVRDAARFILDAATSELSGVLNVARPDRQPYTARELVDDVVSATGFRALPRWVDERVVAREGVTPWVEVPLWLPTSSPERHLMRVSVERATAAGLTCRPTFDTVNATTRWYERTRRCYPHWLPIAREQAILAGGA